MPCTSPLNAFRSQSGGVTFKRDTNTTEQLQLPCGQCMDCRLERSRQWAIRILHEASLHEHNHFLTLTYNADNEPRDLQKTHLQKFWKRLRFNQYQKQQTSPRYYACGEYGDIKGRPHYHAAAFNLQLDDLKHYSGTEDRELFTSEYLDKTWGMGECKIGRLTFESAMYVAAYVTKKVTGKKAANHYESTDPETGEIYTRASEFACMSLRPAIGRPWIEKYTDDVYNYDHIVVNGQTGKAPRYYDKYLEQTNPARLEKWKTERKEKAKQYETENTTARLKTKAKITQARLKLKRKTL